MLGSFLLISIASAAASGGHAVVAAVDSPLYGSVLVVGSGVLKGDPLYEFSGDRKGKIGCGTTVEKGYDFGPIAAFPLRCSGPMEDMLTANATDDWPTFTSQGSPFAASGVSQSLLGTVERTGIGAQVTYNGHPLYLFDPSSSPFKPGGEDYVETVHPLAPWHGYWSLVSSQNGSPAQGIARLEQGVLPNGSKVLAVARDVNVDPIALTVYTFGRESSRGNECGETCMKDWIPLLTFKVPTAKAPVNTKSIGRVRVGPQDFQVTFDGAPLYLYTGERTFLTKNVKLKTSGSSGNGAGVAGPQGRRASFILLPAN